MIPETAVPEGTVELASSTEAEAVRGGMAEVVGLESIMEEEMVGVLSWAGSGAVEMGGMVGWASGITAVMVVALDMGVGMGVTEAWALVTTVGTAGRGVSGVEDL